MTQWTCKTCVQLLSKICFVITYYSPLIYIGWIIMFSSSYCFFPSSVYSVQFKSKFCLERKGPVVCKNCERPNGPWTQSVFPISLNVMSKPGKPPIRFHEIWVKNRLLILPSLSLFSWNNLWVDSPQQKTYLNIWICMSDNHFWICLKVY